MKKRITAALAAGLLLMTLGASSESVSIGTNMTLQIPSAFQSEKGTMDDGQAYIAYCQDALQVYIYEIDAKGSSLSELVDSLSAKFSAAQKGTTWINGIETGYFVANNSEKGEAALNICYLIPSGNSMVYVDFYMADSTTSQQTADIMNTLSQGETPAAAAEAAPSAAPAGNAAPIGTTGLSFVLPSGFTPDELTAEDRESDVTAAYYNDEMDIVVYQYDAEGASAEEAAREFAEEFKGTLRPAQRCGSLDMIGIESTFTEGGETDACESWVAVTGGQVIAIEFYYEQGMRPSACSAILESIH